MYRSTSRLVILLLVTTLVACAAAAPATRTPPATPGAASFAQPSCTSSRFVISSAGPEVEGIATGANQFWALLFDSPPLPPTRDVKIVFRLTSTGSLTLAAFGPGGVRIAPDWVQEHDGSTWNTHPGDEWGAGFTFPHSGCWEVVAIRGSVVGRVGFPVA
jgi:hypothetical protein